MATTLTCSVTVTMGTTITSEGVSEQVFCKGPGDPNDLGLVEESCLWYDSWLKDNDVCVLIGCDYFDYILLHKTHRSNN